MKSATHSWHGLFLILIFILGAGICPAQKLDWAFVMDGSGSIDNADFSLQKSGIIAMLRDTNLVPRDGTVAFGLVQFASSARVEIPMTLINSEADVTNIVGQLSAISQLGSSTGPGAGISTASLMLAGAARADASQIICLSTDGTPNTGPSLSSALSAARSASYGLEAFGVIGIRCPGAFEEGDLQGVYGSEVFGGGGVVMVFSSSEFANSVGTICLGTPLKLVGVEVIQTVQDWKNSVRLIEGKSTLVFCRENN